MRLFYTTLIATALAASGDLPSLRGAPGETLAHRSVSRSHQFVVYAADANARATIAMAVEDTKDKILKLLDTADNWKRPIVIQVTPASSADPNVPPSMVRVINTDDGFKVELDVVLGDDPRDARFPQQLVRAILLEYAYRNQPKLVATGATYAEPPAWLIEGIANITSDRDPGVSSGLFRSLIASGKTPTLGAFLSQNPVALDNPSQTLYSACAMSLVRLLADLPNGRPLMQGYLRHLPGPGSDPEAELLKAFPALNAGSASLEKWWTVGLASQSATDRYQGLTLDETTQQLDGMLTLDVAMDKAGTVHKSFTMGQYSQFAKAPGATAALHDLSVRLLGLEAQATPIMRDVVAAYQVLAVELTQKKSAHLDSRLDAIAGFRKKLTAHMDQISDYLNWYEATQYKTASGSFDEYIRTADELEKEDASAQNSNPISQYLDSVNHQLAQ